MLCPLTKNSSFEEQRHVNTVYNSIQQRIPKQVIGQLPLFIDKLIEMLSEENRCHRDFVQSQRMSPDPDSASRTRQHRSAGMFDWI